MTPLRATSTPYLVMGDEARVSDWAAVERLAKLVQKRRERKGWSQSNLAAFTGLSRDVVKRLEAGDTDVRATVIFRVLPVLECSAADIQKVIYGQVSAKRAG